MVKQKVIFDTNILIDHLRQNEKLEEETQLEKIVQNIKITPLVSVASIQELFAGQSSREKKEEQKIKKALALFKTIILTPQIAKLAGKIMRDTKPIIQFADAQIAAATITEKASLLTKNKKDFIKIKKLKLYTF